LSKEVENMSTSPGNNTMRPSAGRAFVLDDEPQVAAIVSKVLEACGFVPHQFTSPPPFLTELMDSPPDLVVLDLSLGQSDAVEAIRHLEVSAYRGKVLLISGRDETTLNEITQIGTRRGLAMLPPLRKPFRPADIKQRLSSGQTPDGAGPGVRDSHTAAGGQEKPRVQLAEALQNNWLEVWYQPKFDLKTFAVCGAEGLIRARHPCTALLIPRTCCRRPAIPATRC
jgi:CheY-like chemotaxis protein